MTLDEIKALAVLTRAAHIKHENALPGPEREATLAVLIELNKRTTRRWVVTLAKQSGFGVHLDGINLFTGETFSWHIVPSYGWGAEFDLTHATMDPETRVFLAHHDIVKE
ncbi:MAG: hypothetical protein M0R22_13350 [Dehalococcoidia bacterium]|jgi:hypothetical protein|nr:hypothetical protein [Dehalococcoidia bacterium]